MPISPYRLLRPALFRFDAERIHEHSLQLLSRHAQGPLARLWKQPFVSDPVTLAGLSFPNRVGLAAGLDKNAMGIDAFLQMGFGCIEVGTVTPKAQTGNEKPRLFRLPRAQAIINRMGFNNDGLQAFTQNVKNSRFYQEQFSRELDLRPRLGLNIGKNALTPMAQAIDDYLQGLQAVYPFADYVAINISSPNTKNLRQLQEDSALEKLLHDLKQCQLRLSDLHARQVPLFLKIAPDLNNAQITAIAHSLLRHGIDGVIATNTTLSRPGVEHLPQAHEAGGLSGVPLRSASTRVIARLRKIFGPTFPIIGVGGITSGEDAVEKIQAGADLVQIYTGLIYKGPALVHEIACDLRRLN